MLSLPLALDAMGGDHAPQSVIRGAVQALERHPGIRFLIFGREPLLTPLIKKHKALLASCEVIHADSVVANDDKPSHAVRHGRGTSMGLAVQAVAEGKACAVISAGNTGALMAMSKLAYRTLPGISRPAIAALFPTMRGECVMLDLGANVVCDAQDLFRFAVMGDAFARAVLGLAHPRIGVLNVGSEDMKGHEEVKEASQLIRDSGLHLNFHGFVEGNDIGAGTVDVVVTDGFTGNVALKTAEGTARLIRTFMRDSFRSTLWSRISAVLARGALQALKSKLDDRKRNGAMFLGLAGITVKSHGGADAFSFCNAISVGVELVTHRINERILEELKISTASAEVLPASAESVTQQA